MAIAIDSVGTIQTNSTGVDLTFAHTVSGSDRYLHIGVYSLSANSIIASATYNGVAMTVVETEIEDALSNYRTSVLGLIAPATGTHDVVISLTTMSSAVIKACAISLTGVHQTTPRGTAVKVKATSSAPTVNVSSAADELVFDSVVYYNTAQTVGAGQTQRWNDASFLGSSEVGAATTTMSWSDTTTAWATVAVPIKPAAGERKFILTTPSA